MMTTMPKILIVEDEEDIHELMAYNLKINGFETDWTDNGEEALVRAREERPDLLLLDLMLPGINGLEVCRQIRKDEEMSGLPVVMVTARGEEADVVTGLELGADDYLTKPFSPRVLVARIRSVLRRRTNAAPSTAPEEAVLKIHDLEIDPAKHRVAYKGNNIELTYTEFMLLHCLATHPGRVFTRYQIVDRIRGENHPVTDRSVDVQVVGLRRKLGEGKDLIETVRGVGYRFKDSGE